MQEGNTKLLKSNKVSYGNSELGTLRAATARIIIDVVAYFTPDVIFQLPSTELSLATLSLDQERLAVLLYEVTLTSVELEFLLQLKYYDGHFDPSLIDRTYSQSR